MKSHVFKRVCCVDADEYENMLTGDTVGVGHCLHRLQCSPQSYQIMEQSIVERGRLEQVTETGGR